MKSLKEFTNSCEICQKNRITQSSGQPRVPIPPTGIPFYRWSIDFVQDLPVTEQRNKDIIVAVDHATRFVVAEAVPDRTAKTVAIFLFNLMLKFGAPQELISDRANCFMGDVMKEYLEIQSINHFPSTSYHPNTNGMVERINEVLGGIITKMSLGTPEKWDKFVNAAAFILNARKHSVTGYSPFYLAYGISPQLPGDVFPPCIYSKNSDVSLQTHRELTRLGQHRALALKRSQEFAKQYAATNSTFKQFKIGEFVKLKNFTKKKFQFRWKGPFIVDSIGPHNTYYLNRADGTDLLHPYNGVHLGSWISNQELKDSNTVLNSQSENNLRGGDTVAS